MATGSNFWVIGGEFGSMNFHKLVEGSAQVQGPFKTRKEAEDAWRVVSEENRHKAGVRFSIVEEPARVTAWLFCMVEFPPLATRYDWIAASQSDPNPVRFPRPKA
jgi:hypothetical protein